MLASIYGDIDGVCYLAKIRILKQITTEWRRDETKLRCLLSCKDTNFKANHNLVPDAAISVEGVCYLAKIRILKQITTEDVRQDLLRQVFVILQRYEF